MSLTIVPSSPPVLQLTGICKRFAGVVALHEVALSVRAGEVMALIGENGAGKSTLVKTLTGIYQPDSGSIELGGEAVHFATPQQAMRAQSIRGGKPHRGWRPT